MKNVLKRLFYKLFPKRYYWYQVKYIYKKKDATIILAWQQQIGLIKHKTILNPRQVKKIPKPLHKDELVKHLLCNGIFQVESIAYLGRFKSPN